MGQTIIIEIAVIEFVRSQYKNFLNTVKQVKEKYLSKCPKSAKSVKI